MKVAILIFFSLLSTRAPALCLPESMQKSLPLDLDLTMVQQTVEEFQMAHAPLFSGDPGLMVSLSSENSRINAEIRKQEKMLVIEVMGGMLAHPKMDKSTLSLLLCHELGHYSGGPPTKSRGGWSSTEGQADYYSGSECAKELKMTDQELIAGAIKLTSIYASVTGEAAPEAYRCDEREVVRINFGYPPAQCRLDTILAGWQGLPRPRCWFVE
jgi:hypothetical protein